VDRAGRETRLEEALADVDRAADLLTERRNEATLAAAGNFLLDEAEAEHEVESQPQMFRQASRWFGMFTRGRYDLHVAEEAEPGSHAFRALETTSGRGLALGELSRGTRMQLLLAVRLAFAAAAERGTQLPFVLDEVLSSTDPVRYEAVTECLLALVKDGRQVFYLTCQPVDAAAWQAAAEELGLQDVRRLDLADLQHRQWAASAPLPEWTVQLTRVPEPGDMSLTAYAEVLGVPELKPAAGARGAHLAHLVEDAEQLHRLLKAGVERYGQLERLTRCGNVNAYVRDDVLARIRARACVLDAFAEGWAIGRGRAVSREVLRAAGVSERYIDGVTDLARDLDWDARKLVETLRTRADERARGFRQTSLESIRDSLTESGHLDERGTLDEEELRGRVLAAANDSVERGAIDAGEVREFFARCWRLCAASGQ